MKKIFLLSLLIFSTVASAQTLLFKNSLVPEAPPNARVMVAYMEIHNLSDKAITIKQFKSIDFESVELHETKIVKGIAKMSKKKSLTVEAKQSITLQSGGLHLMLIKPKKRFKQGELVQLELIEANKTRHIIEVSVKKHHSTHHH